MNTCDYCNRELSEDDEHCLPAECDASVCEDCYEAIND
jgi:hypothetical protein